MHKIMYLITELDVGGAETSLCRLVCGINRKEYDPIVACLKGHGAFGKALEERGIPVHYLNMSRFDVGVIRRLAVLLRDNQIGLLHTFLFHANMVGRIAARLARTNIVVSSTRVAEPRRWHLWLESWTHRLVQVQTCVSESARRYTVRRSSVPAYKLVTIPNGVDIAALESATPLSPDELPTPPGARLVLFVGRLHKQKGVKYLLKAARKVVKESPDVHFLIAGKGRLEQKLKRFCRRKRIEGNVHWLGFRSDIARLMQTCDMLVCPSLWEGMPNVILEAMACGRPVVASRIGGCTDVIDDNVTGVLVPPKDANGLAQAILRLLRSPDEAKQLGLRALRKIEKEFTVDKMVERNTSLYQHLFNKMTPLGRIQMWGRSRLRHLLNVP